MRVGHTEQFMDSMTALRIGTARVTLCGHPCVSQVVDVGTRPEPRPATESDIADIPTHVKTRLACTMSDAERLIGVVGELEALHVASVDDVARRKTLCLTLLSEQVCNSLLCVCSRVIDSLSL